MPIKRDNTAPKGIKYKSHTFKVRENFIGVGAELDELMQKLDDAELMDMVWLYRLPEYQQYQQIRNDMRQISIDINQHKELLKGCKDKQRIKELTAIITAGEKAFNTERDKLYEPMIAGIMLRETQLSRSINFRFINDTDNLKHAASALLIGDLTVINYDDPDNDLKHFRDAVFQVFFYTRVKIQQGLTA